MCLDDIGLVNKYNNLERLLSNTFFVQGCMLGSTEILTKDERIQSIYYRIVDMIVYI